MKELRKIFMNGIIDENPTFRMVLGMCPTLAITTAVSNGIGMGLAVTFVLVFSNLVISLLRKAIIVVPLTLLLPRLGLGTAGVFLAEPISNLLGGLACFTTMFFTVYRRLGTDPDRLSAGG